MPTRWWYVAATAAVVVGCGISWTSVPHKLAEAPLSRPQLGVTWDTFILRASRNRERWREVSTGAQVDVATVDAMRAVSADLSVLAIASETCGDSQETLPYVALLLTRAGVGLRVTSAEEAGDLASRHKTRDGRFATPTLIFYRSGIEVGVWIERPAPAETIMHAVRGLVQPSSPDWIAAHKALMDWYRLDQGRTAMREIIQLVQRSVRATGVR